MNMNIFCFSPQTCFSFRYFQIIYYYWYNDKLYPENCSRHWSFLVIFLDLLLLFSFVCCCFVGGDAGCYLWLLCCCCILGCFCCCFGLLGVRLFVCFVVVCCCSYKLFLDWILTLSWSRELSIVSFHSVYVNIFYNLDFNGLGITITGHCA